VKKQQGKCETADGLDPSLPSRAWIANRPLRRGSRSALRSLRVVSLSKWGKINIDRKKLIVIHNLIEINGSGFVGGEVQKGEKFKRRGKASGKRKMDPPCNVLASSEKRWNPLKIFKGSWSQCSLLITKDSNCLAPLKKGGGTWGVKSSEGPEVKGGKSS